MSLISNIWSKIRINKPEFVQTFTYFIPAPPARKSGYREKNFDSLTNQLSEMGFDIVDIKTQTLSSKEQPGLFIILKLIAKTEEAKNLRPSEFPQEFNASSESNFSSVTDSHTSEKTIELTTDSDSPNDEGQNSDKVEGIYYID